MEERWSCASMHRKCVTKSHSPGCPGSVRLVLARFTLFPSRGPLTEPEKRSGVGMLLSRSKRTSPCILDTISSSPPECVDCVRGYSSRGVFLIRYLATASWWKRCISKGRQSQELQHILHDPLHSCSGCIWFVGHAMIKL